MVFRLHGGHLFLDFFMELENIVTEGREKKVRKNKRENYHVIDRKE